MREGWTSRGCRRCCGSLLCVARCGPHGRRGCDGRCDGMLVAVLGDSSGGSGSPMRRRSWPPNRGCGAWCDPSLSSLLAGPPLSRGVHVLTKGHRQRRRHGKLDCRRGRERGWCGRCSLSRRSWSRARSGGESEIQRISAGPLGCARLLFLRRVCLLQALHGERRICAGHSIRLSTDPSLPRGISRSDLGCSAFPLRASVRAAVSCQCVGRVVRMSCRMDLCSNETHSRPPTARAHRKCNQRIESQINKFGWILRDRLVRGATGGKCGKEAVRNSTGRRRREGEAKAKAGSATK